MQEALNFLKSLGISYKLYKHKAVFNTSESSALDLPEASNSAKNLFLRNEKKTRYFLLTLPHGKSADLKNFALKVGERRLSFASPEDLKAKLNLTPGSVSPMGLIYDREKKVEFWLDEGLYLQPDISIHPNINTATINLAAKDFQRAVKETGHTINIFQ